MTKKQLTYAEALAEIEETIQKIENDEFTIDELSDKVKRISFLISFCKEKLRSTENELNNILDKMQE
jgi:exodeoxyribonuclease VII small subunit